MYDEDWWRNTRKDYGNTRKTIEKELLLELQVFKVPNLEL